MHTKRLVLVGVTIASAWFGLLACSKKADNESAQPRTLTQAQRDSAIAKSALPGAGVVGKALEVADSAEARADDPIPEP